MNCSCCKYSRNSSGNVQFPGHQSIPARSCVTLLKTYKRFVSPFLPPSCRFTPTCSEYAIDAIRKRGLVRGMIMAVCRLLRCHPFARGGYDPVE